MTDDKKKYNTLENVLTVINGKYISLSDAETKKNNIILKQLLDLIIPKLKESDSLFKEMYTTVFYGGSFYDGLRIKKPDEFDLDLLLQLPKLLGPEISTSNKPGYVHLKLSQYEDFKKQAPLVTRYKGIEKLIDKDNYLSNEAVRKWMEGAVTKALSTNFNKNANGSYIFRIPSGTFTGKVRKAGPAFTLDIITPDGAKLDVDLVPCFVFAADKWPQQGFRSNPVPTKSTFFIVPKPIKGDSKGERYWRLSFQEQERVLMNNNKTLKPTIKLLKKIRDKLDHKSIASYYLKTLVLWEAEKRDASFWNNSLSYVFMNILNSYQKALEEKKIPYYWNKKYNLIGQAGDLTNFANAIKYMIGDVERNLATPMIIAKHILTPREYSEFSNDPSVRVRFANLNI